MFCLKGSWELSPAFDLRRLEFRVEDQAQGELRDAAKFWKTSSSLPSLDTNFKQSRSTMCTTSPIGCPIIRVVRTRSSSGQRGSGGRCTGVELSLNLLFEDILGPRL